MTRLFEEGKVKYIGLSEDSLSTIQRAHKVHPLTSVQSDIHCGVAELRKK